jgi:hypothetical protein
MNDDLADRLDTVERRAGIADTDDGPGSNVFIGRFSTDLPERYRIVTEPPEEDPIDRHTTVAIPKILPPSYRGGVTVLDDDAIRELWDTMPEDVREREREYRREHGEPIPPVLAEEGDESE